NDKEHQRFRFNPADMELVKNFQDRINHIFSAAVPDNDLDLDLFTTITFVPEINAKKMELKAATTDAEKLNIVMSAISSFHNETLLPDNKALLMFYETVFVGVVQLNNIRRVIDDIMT